MPDGVFEISGGLFQSPERSGRIRVVSRIRALDGAMKHAEEQLAAIGFGRNRREPACWRSVRLDGSGFPAPPAETGAEPAYSRTLMRWREILARDPVAPAYRISRADR